MMLSRRGFFGGLLAAPAIIKVAPLMKISAPKDYLITRLDIIYPTLQEITRKSIQLWKNSNDFLIRITSGSEVHGLL